jgi:hypothetical protein
MTKNMENWDAGKPPQHRRNTEEISRAGHKTEGTPKEHRRNQAALWKTEGTPLKKPKENPKKTLGI